MDDYNDGRTSKNNDVDELNRERIDDRFADIDRPSVFPDGSRNEEIASEMTTNNISEADDRDAGLQMNSAVGWIALAISIISFFIMPIVLGVVAIIIGFVARARDAEWLGNTAIAIGIISIIVRLFIYPFF